MLPDSAAPGWSREKLWNAAELSEARKDARTAREWEVAFPAELSKEGRRVTALEFAHSLVQRYGCAVDIAWHEPGKKGDSRNHHAHLLTTTRTVVGSGLGEKTTLELSNAKRASMKLGWTHVEIEEARSKWADVVNTQLQREGPAERIDHRSLAVQKAAAESRGDLEAAAELDRAPLPRLTRNVMQMERRGIRTTSGEQRRLIEETNAAKKELRQIEKEWASIEAELSQLAELEKEATVSRPAEQEMPARGETSKGAKVSSQQPAEAFKSEEKAVAEPVQISPPVKPSRPSVPSPAVKKKAKVPAVPPRDPVETEFIEFLEGMPFEEAVKYVRNLPNLSKWEGTVTAREVFNEIPGAGFGPRPGQIWNEESWAKQRLEGRKEVTKKELEKALAANKGWFGRQKKDTPEILEMKKKIEEFELDIGKKALTIEECKKLWNVEEPRCQQVADERNAKRQLNRRFGPFVAAGKLYVQQIQQQTQKEPKPLERARTPDKGLEL